MNILDQVLEFLKWVWAFWQVKFIVAHIGLNVAVAVAASIYTGEFMLGKLGQFLYKKVLPYVMVFAAFAGLGTAANMSAITNIAFAGLEAMLLADLLDNLKRIGMSIPNTLTK